MSDSYDDYEAKMQLAEQAWEKRVDETAKREHEPVAWIDERCLKNIRNFDATVYANGGFDWAVPLYTAPPKKEWVGLTALEVYECWKTGDVVEAVEAKLKEKNHG